METRLSIIFDISLHKHDWAHIILLLSLLTLPRGYMR